MRHSTRPDFSDSCNCVEASAKEKHCGCVESAEEQSCSCAESPETTCLGRICGTSIHTDDVDFTPSRSNLVYMDKVYSYNQATSCPILFHLDTGRTPAGTFHVDIDLSDPIRSRNCGASCGCCGCNLDPDAVFTVESGTATLDHIMTRPPDSIDPDQVTIDGFPADAVTFSNGLYTVDVSGLLSKIQKTRCKEAGLPTKHFFLLQGIGHWTIRATFTLRGTVNSNGKTCRFVATFELDDDAPGICVPPHCPSSFAIPDLALPCTANGIAPDINFQFGGKLKLINPQLCYSCIAPPQPAEEPATSCDCNSSPFGRLALVTQLVLEPNIHAESVRRSLFCIRAREGQIPCSPAGTELSFENTDCPNPFAPDCPCDSTAAESAACNCENRPAAQVRPSAFQFNGCNGCTW